MSALGVSSSSPPIGRSSIGREDEAIEWTVELWCPKADHAGPDVAVMFGNYLDDVAHLPCLSIVGGSRHVESLRHSPADCLRLSERCAEMTLVCTGIPCTSASRVKSNSLSL